MLIYERFIARMCCFILKTQLSNSHTCILANQLSSCTVLKFDSLTVGEFDSLTVGMRVALPPGVAGARGGKVSFPCLLSLSPKIRHPSTQALRPPRPLRLCVPFSHLLLSPNTDTLSVIFAEDKEELCKEQYPQQPLRASLPLFSPCFAEG